MKRPDNHSNRPDLPSGTFTVAGQNPFTNHLEYVGSGAKYAVGSVVLASVQDPNAILPLPGPQWLHASGWIDNAGNALVEVHVEGAAANLTKAINVNWMVFPPGGTASAP